MGVRESDHLIVLGESHRWREEGDDGSAQPVMETWPGYERPDKPCQPHCGEYRNALAQVSRSEEPGAVVPHAGI